MGDEQQPRTLAVDIGGSGIKALVLDAQGNAITERLREETPQPATPEPILETIGQLAAQQGDYERVSVGFPGVIHQGVTKTAANLNPEWINFDLASALCQRLQKPVRVANDADIQGYGAIANHGVELVITLGTGFGSALFVKGHLVPNLELGHHLFRRDRTYEEQLGRAALDKIGKEKWNNRLMKAIINLEKLFNYDYLYLGGGNAKHINLELPPNVKIISNELGLFGGIALWRESSF